MKIIMLQLLLIILTFLDLTHSLQGAWLNTKTRTGGHNQPLGVSTGSCNHLHLLREFLKNGEKDGFNIKDQSPCGPYVKQSSPGGTRNNSNRKKPSPGDTLDGKDPHCVKDRSVIVQLFSWVWQDVARECETVLGPQGFCGVQVSPPNEHRIVLEPFLPWYERYQPVSYKLTSRSGTEQQFKDMVARCNRVGVRVYVDAVINHMTGAGKGRGSAGSLWDGDELSYPAVPYNQEHFHCCHCTDCNTASCNIQDYSDVLQVRNCRLLGLRDLALAQRYVRKKVVEYLNTLIDIGVAGFRIDAAKHMWPEELAAIVRQLHQLNQKWFPRQSRPFLFQEVIDYGSETVSATEYLYIGRVTEFRYGRELTQAFRKSNGMKLANLRTFAMPGWGMLPDRDALVFLDNHDNQRGHGGGGSVLTFRQPHLYKMATAFMLAWPYGVPRVMSSYNWPQKVLHYRDINDWIGPPSDSKGNIRPVETKSDGSCGNGWICEHRWRPIMHLVQFHNICRGKPVKHWRDNNNNQISFSRGNKGFIAFNNDHWDMDQVLQTGLPPGKYCDVITGHKTGRKCSGHLVTVGANGKAHVRISHEAELPLVAIHILSKLPSRG